MTLGELIAALEAENPDKILPRGFTNPHSWRGDYMQLAFEPASNVTVGEMLADARSALGATFTGWKGGEYTMSEYTDCWLCIEGTSDGETIGPLLLRHLLAAGEVPSVDQEIVDALRDAARQVRSVPPFVREVVRDLAEPDQCRFDHHGHCQEHGWLEEGTCPHRRAQDLLAAWDEPVDTGGSDD